MNREDEKEEGIEPSNVVLSLFSAHSIDCVLRTFLLSLLSISRIVCGLRLLL